MLNGTTLYPQPHQRKYIKNSGINLLSLLIELLIEKGLLTTEELDERKRQVAERLVKRFVDSGLRFCIRTPSTTNTRLVRK
ncbi:MAG: hypothetical protein QG610_2529 [Euryarchaeota archaeon]|nr:hypothetical protein [Euryarchaeota archaeon]